MIIVWESGIWEGEASFLFVHLNSLPQIPLFSSPSFWVIYTVEWVLFLLPHILEAWFDFWPWLTGVRVMDHDVD